MNYKNYMPTNEEEWRKFIATHEIKTRRRFQGLESLTPAMRQDIMRLYAYWHSGYEARVIDEVLKTTEISKIAWKAMNENPA